MSRIRLDAAARRSIGAAIEEVDRRAMNEQDGRAPRDSAYVARLWECPELSLAIFGMQIHSEEAGAMYAESGISEQMQESLAQESGLLCVREFPEGNGGLMLQY